MEERGVNPVGAEEAEGVIEQALLGGLAVGGQGLAEKPRQPQRGKRRGRA